MSYSYIYYIPYVYFTIGIIAFYFALKLLIRNLRKVAEEDLKREKLWTVSLFLLLFFSQYCLF